LHRRILLALVLRDAQKVFVRLEAVKTSEIFGGSF